MSSNTSNQSVRLSEGLIRLMLWMILLAVGSFMFQALIAPIGVFLGVAMFKIARGNPDLATRKEAVFMIVTSVAAGIAVSIWPFTPVVIGAVALAIALLEGLWREYLQKDKEVSV